MQANGNVAFYGAALFLFSSLVPADARLANVTASGNEAAVGPAAFWVHAASPTAEFQCQDCSLEPQTPVPLATEVLRLAFARQPPQVAEQGQPLASFTVQLLDYYSALGIAAAGDCVVMSTTAGAAIQVRACSCSCASARPCQSCECTNAALAVHRQPAGH